MTLLISTFFGAAIAAVIFYLVFFSARKNDEAYVLRFREELRSLLGGIEKVVQGEFARDREEGRAQSRGLREEIAASIKDQRDSLLSEISNMAKLQKQELELLRETVQQRLRELQKDNEGKLEQMRLTVDEKLHATLEKRLSESFQLVSQQLDAVHKGLGEMQGLATGVGDLRRLLTNVKSRGTWAEIELKALINDILTKDQYEENVQVKETGGESVEIALKLPGPDRDLGRPVWLPIDSKFPRESYERVVDARDKADREALEIAVKELANAVKSQAKKISGKYLEPPRTTDFGIMFLPSEGLYAEAMQIRGLQESLQRDYRIVVCGPSTLAVFLNSLQMGFRTLAIEKRSSEVWELLGAIKSEFGKFGEILEATQDKLDQASKSIETAAKKSRGIEKKLKKVQELPHEESLKILNDPDSAD
ncbi:MAG: DNA recombination protein RmuC [Elusimicrobiota bacterium]